MHYYDWLDPLPKEVTLRWLHNWIVPPHPDVSKEVILKGLKSIQVLSETFRPSFLVEGEENVYKINHSSIQENGRRVIAKRRNVKTWGFPRKPVADRSKTVTNNSFQSLRKSLKKFY